MPRATWIASLAAIAVICGLSNAASARGRPYPLTRCGPDLAYLCPIHGYFDMTPFHYNLAIYPGCIRPVAVETPRGTGRRLAMVCG